MLYEESLDDKTVMSSINHIQKADTLIIAGTSLTVYPAAGFVRYFNGNNLVLINRDKTQMDNMATFITHENVGKVLSELEV